MIGYIIIDIQYILVDSDEEKERQFRDYIPKTTVTVLV